MTDTLTAVTADELEILLSKIERLWRKANDPAATQPERELFEAKALSLMERHRIDQAMLNLCADDVLGDHTFGRVEGRYARADMQILSAVAFAYSCRTWWYSYASHKNVSVFGYKSDADKVIRLSKLLISDAKAQAALLTSYSPAATFSLRRGFILGYASAIAERLREAAKIARTEARGEYGTASDGAQLVLVDRSKTVDSAYRARKISSASPMSRANARGHSAGREAGANADLSGGSRRVGNGAKALGR